MVRYDFETGTLEFNKQSKTRAPLVLGKRNSPKYRGKVLICDTSSEPTNITDTLGFALENMDYSVMRVEKIATVLEHVCKSHFDFILIDDQKLESNLENLEKAMNHRSKSNSVKTKVIPFGTAGFYATARNYNKLVCSVKWSKDISLDEILENIQVDMVDVQQHELYNNSSTRVVRQRFDELNYGV